VLENDLRAPALPAARPAGASINSAGRGIEQAIVMPRVRASVRALSKQDVLHAPVQRKGEMGSEEGRISWTVADMHNVERDTMTLTVENTHNVDEAIIVPGSVEWLGQMVASAFTTTQAAQKRVWLCRDEVARLKRDLSAAQQRLATAEREYDADGVLMREVWSQLRSELENARRVSSTQDDEPRRTITHWREGDGCSACFRAWSEHADEERLHLPVEDNAADAR